MIELVLTRGRFSPIPLLIVACVITAESGILSRHQGLTVRGVVVDATTHKPVPGAKVTILPTNTRPERPRTVARTALTDSKGGFSVELVPSGRYHIRADRTGFVSGAYGQYTADDLPRDVSLLRDIEQVIVPLWPPGVVSGRVYDEFQEPVIRAAVTLMKARYVGGRQKATIVAQEETDDRGEFRFASLMPGEYRVAVLSSVYAVPESTITMIEDLLNTGGAPAARQIARRYEQTGVKRPTAAGVNIGGFYLQGLWAGELGPAAGLRPANPDRYDTAYYSGSTSWSSASTVTIEAGETRVGIDISLRAVATRQISGLVEGPAGPVPHIGVTLHREVQDSILIDEPPFASGLTDAGGRFTLFGVPLGRYIAKVLNVPTEAARPDSTSSLRLAPVYEAFSGETIVEVNEQPSSPVKLSALPGASLGGHIEFHDGRPSNEILQQTRLIVVPQSRSAPSTEQQLAPNEGGHFESAALPPGTYRIDVSVPPGTSAYALFVHGQDVLGKAFEVRPGESQIEVIVRVGNASGRDLSCALPDATSATGAYVFVLPQDYSQWVLNGAAPHWMRFGFADNGTFVARDLPEGDYMVIAGVGKVPNVGDAAEMARVTKLATVTRVRGRGPQRVTVTRLADTRPR